MIAAQLDRLREVDPATWEIYEQEAGCFQFDDQRRGWILQAVLQEAISSRCWLLEQSTFTDRPTARIWKSSGPIHNVTTKSGDSPTCALLAAYLEAITC